MAGMLGVTLEKRDTYILSGGNDPVTADVLRRCLKIVRIAAGLILIVAVILGGLHGMFL